MARVGQKGSSSFERVTWEEALNLIRDKFTEAIERDGSESILPYSYLGHQGLLNGLHCGDRFFNKIGATIGERTFCNSTASKAFSMVAGPTGGLDPESFKHSRLIIIWGMNLLSTSVHHGRIVLDAVKMEQNWWLSTPSRTSIAKSGHSPSTTAWDRCGSGSYISQILSFKIIWRMASILKIIPSVSRSFLRGLALMIQTLPAK